jgi:AraC-like DNA-binding protein
VTNGNQPWCGVGPGELHGPCEGWERALYRSETAVAVFTHARLIQCGFQTQTLARARGRSVPRSERDGCARFGSCPHRVIHKIRGRMSGARVNEIAYELGSSDPKHLSRALHELYATTAPQILKKARSSAPMSHSGRRVSQNGK